jgi:simple sugar transport system substrate-binding protein
VKKILVLVVLAVALFGSCGGAKKADVPAEGAGKTSIGVFIPGVMSGSAIYEMLARGVEQAAAELEGVEVTVIEGGYNQAEWESRVTSMAAAGEYDLIVSSNPSLPAIAGAVSEKFPEQRFLLLDGELAGNPMIYTMRYNQREQAYMAGYIAALVSEEAGQDQPKVGLLAAQEYPVMNDIILPGFLEGARAVNPGFAVDFRLVGNWFDAAKAAEIAEDMILGGVKVILAISGGANEGALRAAADRGAKVVWFDTNGYGLRPGTVVGSAILRQEQAAYEQTKRFLAGTLPFGSAEVVGVAEGYVDFIQDDPGYIASVSREIREAQGALIDDIRSRRLSLGE